MYEPASVDLCERPAELTSGTEEVAKRHMLALGLQVPAIISKLSTRNVFEYQIRDFRVQVSLMQGDDVGMRAYLA